MKFLLPCILNSAYYYVASSQCSSTMDTNHISVAPGKKHSATKFLWRMMKKSLGLDFMHHSLNVGCTYQMKIEKMLWFRHKLNFVDFRHNLQTSHVEYISECKCSVGYKCIKLVFNRYAIYSVFFFWGNLWNKFNRATTYKDGAHLFWFRVWNVVLFTCSVTNVKFGLICFVTSPLLCTKFVASNRTCFLSPTSWIVISTPLVTSLRICCIR